MVSHRAQLSAEIIPSTSAFPSIPSAPWHPRPHFSPVVLSYTHVCTCTHTCTHTHTRLGHDNQAGSSKQDAAFFLKTQAGCGRNPAAHLLGSLKEKLIYSLYLCLFCRSLNTQPLQESQKASNPTQIAWGEERSPQFSCSLFIIILHLPPFLLLLVI